MDKIKTAAKKLRDSLQQGIYVVINPIVQLLIKLGVTPNAVTTIGFLGNVAAAVIVGIAAYKSLSGPTGWSLLIWGGALILGFSLRYARRTSGAHRQQSVEVRSFL